MVPVIGSDGTTYGAAMLMHDVSPEISLEARCQSLHEMATKDPLTQMANRAEFDRVHEMFVVAHLERRLPCSLIMADIDHFKGVNDTYGHPAGDAVLKSFSALLKRSCRPGDLVARFGGEEFVMLCTDSASAVATQRADAIRKAFAQTQQPELGGRCVTCSFGVTEIQDGDTPATMLARSDRALYQAKARGRNNVVQLGSGISGGDEALIRRAATAKNLIAEQHLVTAVPLSIAIEKLRGFVADHHAEIVSIEENEVQLRVGSSWGFLRRRADRSVPMIVDLKFEERAVVSQNPGADAASVGGTRIHVAMVLVKKRDRRRDAAVACARKLLASLRAYLMAADDVFEPAEVREEGESS